MWSRSVRPLPDRTSSAQTVLSDTLFGYQVLFGVDYALTEALLLGVKGRWVNFQFFSKRRQYCLGSTAQPPAQSSQGWQRACVGRP